MGIEFNNRMTFSKTLSRCLFRRVFPAIVFTSLAYVDIRANDWAQWRGPQRNGVSEETGLLQEWPKEGPKLLWKVSDVGRGYSAPAVKGNTLYLIGNDGLSNEFVQAISVHDGHRLWRTRLGEVGNPKQNPSFPAARSTPTVDGDTLYALSSDGVMACVDVAEGKIRWQKNVRTEFGGRPGEWSYSESPLVDGDQVVCTPGGSEATLLALNKHTGDLVWKSVLPEADTAAFASAIVVELGGIRQYVQLLQKGLVGVEATTGKMLWRYQKPVSVYGANIPTPVASGPYVYCASAGTGGGTIKLKVNDGRLEIEPVYFGPKYPTAIGGAVAVDGVLYGTAAQALLCIDFATGQVKWEARSIAPAALLVADHRLYLRGENGEVGLATLSQKGYEEKGRFTPSDQPKPTQQMERSWAYPVVANGCLYLRDHDRLWAYDIRRAP